ncbi:hypothetical protein KB20921_23070 [Edwardsiella ictaluri]|nr:Uncharacterised protein [Edwardsiella ictaluri]BEH99558.1 hypothetical protein KH20906_22860 [Edwardsiella ictaluri]BEI03046.1 hypothetical protein KB20921_23070 [Edwardsiella ictaluri]BEI06507.1 hypothetical protein KH201010_22930 [Edwardsiella ictaluri]BEI09970.1 hypothetical protein STU22726_23010 [Edwardsiella ictaluri]
MLMPLVIGIYLPSLSVIAVQSGVSGADAPEGRYVRFFLRSAGVRPAGRQRRA